MRVFGLETSTTKVGMCATQQIVIILFVVIKIIPIGERAEQTLVSEALCLCQ